MPVTDRLQKVIEVGDIVEIPGVVTTIGGTATNPTVTITTKYPGFDGNTDAIAAVDSIQVTKSEFTPRS